MSREAVAAGVERVRVAHLREGPLDDPAAGDRHETAGLEPFSLWHGRDLEFAPERGGLPAEVAVSPIAEDTRDRIEARPPRPRDDGREVGPVVAVGR